MHRFVKQRIDKIVDSYPIGKEFTSNCIHAELFNLHGQKFLPSRGAVASQLRKLPQLKVESGPSKMSHYVKA